MEVTTELSTLPPLKKEAAKFGDDVIKFNFYFMYGYQNFFERKKVHLKLVAQICSDFVCFPSRKTEVNLRSEMCENLFSMLQKNFAILKNNAFLAQICTILESGNFILLGLNIIELQ